MTQPTPAGREPGKQNTDRVLWLEREGDFYSDSIFVTHAGAIGINCGGRVIIAPLRAWHAAQLTGQPAPSPDMEALRPLVPDTLAGDVAAVESLIEWADKSCVFAGHPFDGGSSGVPVEVCDELIDMLNDSSYTASSIREKSFVKRFISAVESVNRGESVVKQSLTTENGLQSEEINSIERALKSLLQNIAPQIEPFDDVAHLISQIDNWCAGTRNELREEKLLRQTAEAEEAALESQLREARDDNTKLRESEASAAMMRDVLAECVEQLQPAESVDVVIKPGKWPHSLMAAKTVLQSSDAGRSLLAELDAATLCVREIANFIDPNDETEDTPVELGCRLIEEHKSLRAELDAAKAEVERLTKELKASEDAFRVTDEQLRGANEELLSRAARIDDLERQLAEREQSPAPAVGVPVEVEPIWQAINRPNLKGVGLSNRKPFRKESQSMGVLCLSRKKNQTIVIEGGIAVTVGEIRGDKVRLLIDAPRGLAVDRLEVYHAKLRDGRAERMNP